MKKLLLLFLMVLLCGCGEKILSKEQKLNIQGIGYSGCFHCGDKWNWKESHCTLYENNRKMFPLCTECFNKLIYPYVLWYHLKLFEEWKQIPTDEQIKCLSLEIAKHKNTDIWAVSLIKERFYTNGKLNSIYQIKF